MTAARGSWSVWLTRAWSVLLAAALLGPGLGRGFVLTYDMVWVPDLALRADSLGLATGLPRAVPSDAVVAVLDEVVPGELLQKVVLLALLVAAGLGAARLAAGLPLAARVVAVSAYQWNAFVVERLVMGHWPVLVGYAALPWLLDAGRRWRESDRLPARVPVLLVLGCLSASAGVASTVALLAAAGTRSPRRLAQLLGLGVAANAPWLVAGLLHAADATSAAAGSRDFALSAEGGVPAPLAALTLGGIWNSEVVPATRNDLLGWVSLVLTVLLAAAGARSWWQATAARVRTALIACWVIGMLVALVSWAAPALLAWMYEHVPGSALLRDGSRLLVLCAPLLVCLVAHGSAVLLRASAPDRGTRLVFGAVLVLLPLLMLPDPLLGERDRLDAARYPAAYAAAREVVLDSRADGRRGDTVVLPFTSYRRPSWNHGHKVLDPVWRYLPGGYVASDQLIVAGRRISGEDPRVRRVQTALDAPTPEDRARALTGLGVGRVVVDTTAPGGADVSVAGRVLLDGPLQVIELADAEPLSSPASWKVAMGLAWVAFLLGPAASLGLGAARWIGRRRRMSRNAPTGVADC